MSANGYACLWDYDILAMERSRFPETLELITGKFIRHSPEYYKWRIQDRQQRIESSPTPELFDDLAVAFDKIGDHQAAIATALKCDELFPGRYETHANLGTFYIHSGELQSGLAENERALQINPNAHFGRELYQKRLVEYLLAKQSEGKTSLPLDSAALDVDGGDFADFVLTGADSMMSEGELDRAIAGVLGMMRFGNHESPVLLEGLANLLVANFHVDAKRLAARCFLKASYFAEDEDARAAYWGLAQRSLSMQSTGILRKTDLTLAQLEETFAAEMREADEWFASVMANERKWVQAEENVDERFTREYYTDPVVSSPILPAISLDVNSRPVRFGAAVAAAFLLLVVLVLLRRRRNRNGVVAC